MSLFYRAFRCFHLPQFILGLFVVLVSITLVSLGLVQAASGVNQSINYQGRLLTSGGVNVADGNYVMKFSLYSQASGGTPIWTASGTTAVPVGIPVSVTNGLFSVLLGDTSYQGQNAFAIDWNQDGIYLGVTVDGDAEMSPRKRLSSVPSAFNSETLQGNYASSSNISGSSGTGTLFYLNQASSTAATATRTALLIETAGTSDFFDYLLRARATNGADVFSISRNGNVTSTGNFVVGDSSGDTFTVNARLNSSLLPSQDLAYTLGSTSLRFLGVNAGTVSSTSIFNSGSVSTTNLVVSGMATSSRITATQSVGIGVTSATEALDVQGNIKNILQPNQPLSLLAATSVGGELVEMASEGNLLYIADYSLDRLRILNVSNLSSPTEVGSVSVPKAAALAHVGKYVYVTQANPLALMAIVDVSRPTEPHVVSQVTVGSDPEGITVEGRYAYVTSRLSDSVTIVDVANPEQPKVVRTIALGSGLFPVHVAVRKGYAYVAISGDSFLSVIDVSNPALARVVATTTLSAANPQDVEIQGNYAYVRSMANGTVSIVDITNPLNATTVGSVETGSAGLGDLVVSGRYVYSVNPTDNTLSVVDVASATQPVLVQTQTVADDPEFVALSGRGLFISHSGISQLSVYDTHGIETTALVAHSATLGSVNVLGLGQFGRLSLTGDLLVGDGGIFSAGALAISSTNTTSTIGFAVSTTYAEVSNRLTVGGVNVCLANGANCPASSSNFWVENSTSNIVYLATTTRDVLLGGSSTATAGFIFDSQSSPGTSTLVIGGATNTNLLVGTSTYGGGLASGFGLSGNDAFVQGKIGSIEGLFSATGVTVGTGGVVLANSLFYKADAGDFTFKLNDTASSFQFVNGTTNTLTLASSGNVGVGVELPLEALDVKGNIRNVLQEGQSFALVTSTSLGSGSSPRDIAIKGHYVFTANTASSSMSSIDVSDPANPLRLSSVAFPANSAPLHVEVSGQYAFLAFGNTTSHRIGVVDISDPMNMTVVTTTFLGSSIVPSTFSIFGRFMYIADVGGALQILDIADPTKPSIVYSTTTDFSEMSGLTVQDGFLYGVFPNSEYVAIFDVRDPKNVYLLLASDILFGLAPADIAVSGRYAFVSSGDGSVHVVDIADKLNPAVVATVSAGTGGNPRHIWLSGRYLYTGDSADQSVSIFDIADPLNPVFISSISLPGAGTQPFGIKTNGRYLYTANGSRNTVSIIDIGGLETNGLVAHSAELGSLEVLSNATVLNQFTVGGGLRVGFGGIASQGSLAIGATNTTSTIVYAVSTTRAEVSSRLTVGGIAVCLANGANCPSGAGVWTENATSNTVSLVTSTRDVLLGGNSTATAGFIFDSQSSPGTSTLVLGGATNTNVLVGTSTYGGGLNSLFSLSGNDLLVQGQIGSIGGIFSATSVVVGTGTTIYADGGIFRPNAGDFTFNLNQSSSAFRFFAGSTEVLNASSSGLLASVPLNVTTSTTSTFSGGISATNFALSGELNSLISTSGTVASQVSFVSTATRNFVIVGNYAYVVNERIHRFNVVDVSQPDRLVNVATTTLTSGSSPFDVAVQGGYAYVVASGIDAINTIDISNPASPVVIATSTLNSASSALPLNIAANGRYLYVGDGGGGVVYTFDINNPAAPMHVATTTVSGGVVNYLRVDGRYLYAATNGGRLNILDLLNPASPVQVGSVTFPNIARAVSVSGRYAYVVTTGDLMNVVDISNPLSPVTIATTTFLAGTAPFHVEVAGRYVYIPFAGLTDSLAVVDVINPRSPVQVATTSIATTADPGRVAVSGKYVYVLSVSQGTLYSVDYHGIETSGLMAHSLEAGNLRVLTNAQVANNLWVGGSLTVDIQGIFSSGALTVAATNTTSTILFAVSTTQAEISSRLTVGGVSVCLLNGANCPTGAGIWSEEAASNTVFLVTSTRDVLLGGSTTATAGLIFDSGANGTSTLLVGGSTNTNLLVGTSTYDGGLNSLFSLSGNDLLVQGQIGSIGGIFSATSVMVGTGTTVLADGNLYKTSAGDFTFKLNNAGSSFQFINGSTNTLTMASSGNVGIGVTQPRTALDVKGDIQSLIQSNQVLTRLSSTTTGVSILDMETDANYAYVTDISADRVRILDVSNPLFPKLVSSLFVDNPAGIAISGRYLFVTNASPSSSLTVIDASTIAAPVVVATLSVGSDPENVVVNGEYAYVTNRLTSNVSVVRISDPTRPVVVRTVALGSGSSLLPLGVAVQGRYVYALNSNSNSMSIIDADNPVAAVVVATTTVGANPERIFVQGRYAYVTFATGLKIVDISSPASAAVVATLTLPSAPYDVRVAGRYAFVGDFGGSAVYVVDISSSTAPTLITTVTTTVAVPLLSVNGHYLYAGGFGDGIFEVYDIPGLEVGGLMAHAAQLGQLNVLGNTRIGNLLNVGGALSIGSGGLLSEGSLAISSTNTTSTIAYAVSTTQAEISNRLTVGGVAVCLANGTNCPSSAGSISSSTWQYNAASGIAYLTTTTQDVLLGGNTTATAGFIFDSGANGTSTLIVGGSTNTNLLVGTSTYGGGLNSLFSLSGNDLLVQGQIGSIGGIFSATSVTLGAGSLVLANSIFYKTDAGDFTFKLNDAASSFQFINGATNTLTVASSGNVGIGVTQPLSALDVNGTARFMIQPNQVFTLVTSTAIGTSFGGGPNDLVLDGRYLYMANGFDFTVIDVTDPAYLRKIYSTNEGSRLDAIAQAGSRVIVGGSTVSDVSRVKDVTNRAAPTNLSLLGGGFGLTDVAIQGDVAAVVASGSQRFILRKLNDLNAAGGSITLPDPPSSVAIVDRYAYAITRTGATNFYVFDAGSSATTTIVGTTAVGTSPQALVAQGAFAYVANTGSNSVSIVRVSNPATPVVDATVAVGSSPVSLVVSGNYLYVANAGSNSISVVDVSSSTAPSVVTTLSLAVSPSVISVSGKYLYIGSSAADRLLVYELPGVSTANLFAHSAGFGSLASFGPAMVFGELSVNGGLNIGSGGLMSIGAISVMSAGATSTFSGAVSTTQLVANTGSIETSLDKTALSVFGHASTTLPSLQVLSGCDDGNLSADIALFGNTTDNRKVSIRCNGTIFADNGTVSTPADFAEYFYSSNTALLPGQAVVFNPAATSSQDYSVPQVLASTALLREKTVGIVSTRPGFVANGGEGRVGDPNWTVIALLGQVPARANAASGTIQAGDEVMVGDGGQVVKATGPGMTLGRAMENLSSGTGTIQVFVQPRWWAGDLLGTDGSGNALLKSSLAVASTTAVSASTTLIDSPYFSFVSSAWDSASSTGRSQIFNLFADALTATTSQFTLGDASGTALLTISNLGNMSVLGDLTVNGRLYLSKKSNHVGSTSTYLFVDDTAPDSIMIATNADGFQTSSTYDYAERFPSIDNLEAGELVTIDPVAGINYLKRTVNSRDTVVGIVSTKPGFLTGAYTSGTYPIALAGRVPTKVTTANGPIQAGDPLTASDIPGVAMKAQSTGVIVGYALQSYSDSGIGMISVFVKTGLFDSTAGSGSNTSAPVPSSGRGSMLAGLARIAAGQTSVQVRFNSLRAYPLVSVTPYGTVEHGYWVSQVTDQGFTINLGGAANADVVFAWTVVPARDGDRMSLSDGTSVSFDPLTGQVVLSVPTQIQELIQEAATSGESEVSVASGTASGDQNSE